MYALIKKIDYELVYSKNKRLISTLNKSRQKNAKETRNFANN